MTDKILLLNLLPKKRLFLHFMIISILFSISTLTFLLKTYDSYYLTGIINCEIECRIQVTIPYNKIDIFSLDPKIEYLNKSYSINKIIYEEPYLNNGIAYQDLKLFVNLSSENKIINFKVLYNKQRIVRKIKNIIEGG